MASSTENTDFDPRRVVDFRDWDGTNAPVSERAKKYAPITVLAAGLVVMAVVGLTPIREQQNENAQKAIANPDAKNVKVNQPHLSAQEKALISKVLNNQGLFSPEALDSQP